MLKLIASNGKIIDRAPDPITEALNSIESQLALVKSAIPSKHPSVPDALALIGAQLDRIGPLVDAKAKAARPSLSDIYNGDPSQLSKALQNAISETDERHAGAERIMTPCGTIRAYLYADRHDGRACATTYTGRSSAWTRGTVFKSTERREEHLRDRFENALKRVKQRKEKAAPVRKLAKGDILSASWGYEQTNVNFYLVTALVGKTMVEIVEISGATVEHHGMYGSVIANPNNRTGEPMRRRANGTRVKICDAFSAYKMDDPSAPKSYSSYH